MQEYLRARYYLPPSRLYSAVRLLPDKHGYDVPVAGDWVTIAVVAEGAPSSSLIVYNTYNTSCLIGVRASSC
jgi:hypothetical protein